MEKSELLAIRIAFETNRGQYARAIQLGREALAALGHPIPSLDTPIPLMAVKLKTAFALRGRAVEKLARRAEAKDPVQVAVAKLLSQLGPAAYVADRKLFFWLAHEDMRRAVDYGLTSVTAAGCTGYSGYLIARERDYERAHAYGRLGITLVTATQRVCVARTGSRAVRHLRQCLCTQSPAQLAADSRARHRDGAREWRLLLRQSWAVLGARASLPAGRAARRGVPRRRGPRANDPRACEETSGRSRFASCVSACAA